MHMLVSKARWSCDILVNNILHSKAWQFQKHIMQLERPSHRCNVGICHSVAQCAIFMYMGWCVDCGTSHKTVRHTRLYTIHNIDNGHRNLAVDQMDLIWCCFSHHFEGYSFHFRNQQSTLSQQTHTSPLSYISWLHKEPPQKSLTYTNYMSEHCNVPAVTKQPRTAPSDVSCH